MLWWCTAVYYRARSASHRCRALQRLLASTAAAVLGELASRFPQPDLLCAFRILHPRFYLDGGTWEEFQTALTILVAHYGTNKEGVYGRAEDVEAIVDAGSLNAHAGWFFAFARATARVRLSIAALACA